MKAISALIVVGTLVGIFGTVYAVTVKPGETISVWFKRLLSGGIIPNPLPTPTPTPGGNVQIAIRDRSSTGTATFAGKTIRKNDDIATEYNTFSVSAGDHQLIVASGSVTLDLVTDNSDGTGNKWIVNNTKPVRILVNGVSVGSSYSQSFNGTTVIRLEVIP